MCLSPFLVAEGRTHVLGFIEVSSSICALHILLERLQTVARILGLEAAWLARRLGQVIIGIDAVFRGLRGDVKALVQSSAVAFSTSVRKTVHAPVPSSTPRALVLMFTLLASELWAHRRTCKQLAAGKLCCRTAALRFRHSCRDFCEGLRPS